MAEGILIVEDDPDIRMDLAELLESAGYSVLTASNGQDALARLQGGVMPCLILLDLMMPVMNGWDFRAQQLKSPSFADIPVLVLSGASDVEHHATSLGVAGFIAKPIPLDRLFAEVER
ncbi:MAG TPA: response regulator, partial [Myxococcaceae bacterium]|nr:response regulator [Myxococcaceae bacterium]